MENYIPKVYERSGFVYVEMILEAKKCKCCGKIMIKKVDKYHNIFPNWFKLNQDAQMKRAGFVYETATLVDDKPICDECNDAGKADFLCCLCGERHSSDKIKESFGCYPAEFLCKNCYETKPAAIWDKKVEELNEEHRYDFE